MNQESRKLGKRVNQTDILLLFLFPAFLFS